MGRIFLLRHGQTLANRERILQGPRIDTALSEVGEQQAAALGEALAGTPLDAVYSSPLGRARRTAEVVVHLHRLGHRASTAAARLLAVQVAPEIYEMDYGSFAGQPIDSVSGEFEQVLDAWRMGFVDQSFPGGESAILAQYRIRPFAQRVLGQAATDDVAVVAHGRINRVLIATLTGSSLTSLEGFPQANASITELEVAGGAARIVRLNDTAHLPIATDGMS